MRKIAVIVLGVLVFGCGASKRSAQTQKDRDTTRVVIDKRTTGTTPTNTDAVKEAEVPKTANYASPTEAYIAQYSGIAQEEMKLYGIPASITLAQGILESGSGKGRLSVQANNHFGIKCHEWTGERIYHDDDRRQECFRKYNHSKYSYRDHSLFLKERKRYRGLFDLKIDDYKGWARGLKAAGYATDRKYPDKLISLIERYQLHRFDHEVMGAAPRTVVSSHVKTGAKYVVEKGDTLYSISKKFNLTVERLQQLNNIKGTTIDVGQVLVVNQ